MNNPYVAEPSVWDDGHRMTQDVQPCGTASPREPGAVAASTDGGPRSARDPIHRKGMNGGQRVREKLGRGETATGVGVNRSRHCCARSRTPDILPSPARNADSPIVISYEPSYRRKPQPLIVNGGSAGSMTRRAPFCSSRATPSSGSAVSNPSSEYPHRSTRVEDTTSPAMPPRGLVLSSTKTTIDRSPLNEIAVVSPGHWAVLNGPSNTQKDAGSSEKVQLHRGPAGTVGVGIGRRVGVRRIVQPFSELEIAVMSSVISTLPSASKSPRHCAPADTAPPINTAASVSVLISPTQSALAEHQRRSQGAADSNNPTRPGGRGLKP